MQDTRKITKEYRMQHWTQIMRERTESGLSIKGYCEQEGIHQNVYHYWQRKLREAAIERLSFTESTAGATMPMTVPQGWTMCERKTTTKDQNIIEIEIGKSRILISETTDPKLLEKVCRVLMSLC